MLSVVFGRTISYSKSTGSFLQETIKLRKYERKTRTSIKRHFAGYLNLDLFYLSDLLITSNKKTIRNCS